jgi:ABC-type sulfate transport system permease subunit
MGATRWQTVRNVVLPRALPGVMTGTILSLGRAVGETAPLLMVGLAAIGGVPESLTGQGTAMPLQVFAWAGDARELFRTNVAAAGAMTLLVVLLVIGGLGAVTYVEIQNIIRGLENELVQKISERKQTEYSRISCTNTRCCSSSQNSSTGKARSRTMK